MSDRIIKSGTSGIENEQMLAWCDGMVVSILAFAVTASRFMVVEGL